VRVQANDLDLSNVLGCQLLHHGSKTITGRSAVTPEIHDGSGSLEDLGREGLIRNWGKIGHGESFRWKLVHETSR
jgi:hypothetical protein